MCEMCKERDGERVSCQDCGCLICFDEGASSGDGIIRQAYVSLSGDLYCDKCGPYYDRDDGGFRWF